MRFVIIYTVMGLAAWQPLKAEIPYLERLVTLQANNQPVAEIFQVISRQTGVVFSYSQSFPDRNKISLYCNRKPLRLVLNELLKPSGCSYKTRDRYIIITCESKPAQTHIIISGYVLDITDSSALPATSVYIRQTLHSSLSNRYGFFSLSCPDRGPGVALSFAREGFRDTTLLLPQRGKQEMVIYLSPRNIPAPPANQQAVLKQPADSPLPAQADTTPVKPKHDIPLTGRQYVDRIWNKLKAASPHIRNISDTLFSGFSLSLVPGISTNRMLSVNTVSKYSLNILGGYSKGIDVIEVGGLFNIDNGHVRYVQVGGLTNIVSGNVTGLQVGGLVNSTLGNTIGLQVAGLVNANRGSVQGIQVGGITNLVGGNGQGFQAGGIYNRIQNFSGFQVAGIANTVVGRMDGFQVAGLVNKAGVVRGAQIAGLVNVAREAKGLQLAFLNFADTSSGIPVGFLSFVKKGYHKLELAGDELRFATLSFGTGVEQFYTLLIGGVNYERPALWTYGYGLGSGFTLRKKWGLCLNLTAQQILLNGQWDQNLLSRFFAGLEYKARPALRVTLGPSLNVFTTRTVSDSYKTTFAQLAPYHFFDRTTGETNVKMWIGGRLCFKFM